MSTDDPYADYPDVLHTARSKFKGLTGVSTARLGEEWVEDAPGPTVRAVAVYVRDEEGAEEEVQAVADDLGLREHEPARDEGHPRSSKIAFVPEDD